MDMIPVNSDAISALGYDDHKLYVRWKKTGKTYIHKNVPQSVYEQLLAAPSIGKFFSAHVRNQYSGEPA